MPLSDHLSPQDDLDFRPAGRLRGLLAKPSHVALWPMTLCFMLGAWTHLRLDDAWRLSWLPANVWLIAALPLLWKGRGSALGWFFCIPVYLIPLLCFRDQLTQSFVLLLFSCSAAWFGVQSRRPGQEQQSLLNLVGIWQGITLATYLIAGLHKLNAQFLDPSTSCAHYGAKKLVTYWNQPEWYDLIATQPAFAHVVLAMELSIPVLYLLKKHRLAWWVCALFHLPLTLILAPAFAFVMMAGHASFVTKEDLTLWRALWHAEGRWHLMGATLFTAMSLLLHQEWPGSESVLKEWGLWFLILFLGRALWVGRAQKVALERPYLRRWALVVVVAYFLHGLFPYFGLEYQHTGAMLSNLRVDQGCWNSSVFPESVRLRDDYIRVEKVHFKAPGQNQKYEKVVLDHLWTPPQLRQMRRNWCPSYNRPFYMKGSWRGGSFEIQDMCDLTQELPFEGAGVWGVEIFENYLRFQKNLLRKCPQACIH